MVEVINRKYRFYSMIAIFVTALFFGWLGAMAQDRDLPTIILSAAPANPVVKAGGELRIEYNVRRIRSCAVSVDRFIIDSQLSRYELPDTKVSAGLPLGDDHFFLPVAIPPETAPGKATYRTITNYNCNPTNQFFPIQGGVRDLFFVVY